MRILFVTYHGKTIFYSMAPLAWALRAAGHEVRIASQPSFADVITGAGLTAVPVGRAHITGRLAKLHPERDEVERVGLPSPYDAAVRDDVGWDEIREGAFQIIDRWHKFDNVPMVHGVVEIARDWQPDLIIWEPTT